MFIESGKWGFHLSNDCRKFDFFVKKYYFHKLINNFVKIFSSKLSGIKLQAIFLLFSIKQEIKKLFCRSCYNEFKGESSIFFYV